MRIVVKIGTSTLTYQNGKMNLRRIEELARTLADVSNAGNEVILVSSGAIASGASKLRLNSKPQELALKQAAAAVGQCELMYVYDRTFINYDEAVKFIERGLANTWVNNKAIQKARESFRVSEERKEYLKTLKR